MYVIVIEHKNYTLLSECLECLRSRFAFHRFSLKGSEGSGYHIQVDNEYDEKPPRFFAEGFLAAKENKLNGA